VQYAPCGCSPLGKLSQQSQPYAPGGGDAWTVYHYDASGRTTSVVLPDSSTTTYLYQGNTVKVTDPAGKYKVFTMDAFGNLVVVSEPDPTLGTVTTSYTYDVLNHLTLVSMPRGSNTQTRTFNYNSGTTVTGFLQSATNPENGTVTYTYNLYNLLTTKTDAKNQELTYAYDGYNRLTSVSLIPPYTCPPPPQSCNPPPPQLLRTYYYDTNPLDTTGFSQNIAGRLAAVKYPAQSTIQMNDMYSYTAAGQLGAGLPATKRLQVNQPVEYKNNNNQNENENVVMNLDAKYTYNGEGQMTAVTYPSTGTSITPVAGASYTYSYDSMYRLGGMKTSGGTTIVNNVTYNAASQLLTMTYGTITETRGYNTLNQLTSINAQSVPNGTIENLTYNYPTGTNNGKISSAYNAVSGETVTYTYDSLNRLLTANGSGWGQQYGFDGFGNLLSKTVTSGSGPSLSISVNPANNQIQGVSGLSYDANGNQNVGTYDAENRLTAAGTLQYDYDAQNRRIWSWPGTTDSLNNTTSYTVNMYAPGGQKLGAYLFVPATTTQNGLDVPELQVTLSSSDTYFGAHRLAVMDQLGSNVWNSPSSSGTFFPWGEAKGGYNPQDTWNFATYWQDSASGLDYANNRYYANAYGRFMTPDPFSNSGHGNEPQSWNGYAYALGDPANLHDPSGLMPSLTCSQGDDDEDEDGGENCDTWEPDSCLMIDDIISPFCGNLQAGQFLTTVTAPGGNGSANYQDALRAAQQAQSLEGSLKDSAACDKDLTKLGMTWQGLQSAVASESFQDGTESSATMVSLFAGSSTANQQLALAQYGNQTIRNYLMNKGSGAAAVSSAGGNLVFLNYNQFGGLSALDNEATLMHEALHNATGLTDSQLQSKLGLSQGSSQNITNSMLTDCVF
jgi:RHS repeat-associated protein